MSIIHFIGNTPMVKLINPYGENAGSIFVKLEEFNPGGSVKSRVGIKMIEDAERQEFIQPGDTLLEPTGGNTGLGLALAASLKGYKLVLTIPDNFSQEKINVLKQYGAQVILADHRLGNDCHIRKAKEIKKNNTHYKCLNQFENPSNPEAHYLFTGPEILASMQNDIHCFVSVIGSGGTIMGVGKKLKEHIKNISIIGVQPEGCDILNNKYVPHKIQATAVGKVGTFFDHTLIDSMIDVNYGDVQKTRQYLAKKQGLFVGISSGANILAAFELSKNYHSNQKIVTIAPDSGKSYI